MRRMRLTVLLALSSIVTVSLLGMQEQKKPSTPPPMDEKAAMEMMMKLATPGEAHKKLDLLVGTWNAKNTMWMDPSKPPTVSKGTSEQKWVLGGRFLEQRFEGEFMGMPFSGLGYSGYDNYKKKYIGVWMDTAGTAMMNTAGSFDRSGKVMNSTARMDDFTTGKVVTVSEKVTFVNNDEVRMEMFGPGPDGKDYRMMEIVYTRKK
ncbi:MAG TPA: DUF1579 domain-containing protein [Acidobacteriota bacterium]|nr:DUF1579 domain-containing protein [Acidobacteriota bacterium]